MLSVPGERRVWIRSGRGETRAFPRMNSMQYPLVTKTRHWNSVQKWWSLALKDFVLINDIQFPESFSLPSKGIKNFASTIAPIHCT